MKMSFVIPAYNEEFYIGDCLKTIKRETDDRGFDVEIIVVDNASSDLTSSVALSFEGVSVLREANKGIVHARKAGYLASSGDLIAHVDSDSRLTTGWVDRVFKEFESNPELIALSGPFIYYDLPWAVNVMVRIWYYLGYLIHLVNHYIFRNGAMLQGGNFVVKRTAIEVIGGYDTSIKFYGEDTDLARRLGKNGPVKFTFRLPMYSSGRRFAGEGMVRTGIYYAVNFVWVLVFGKPAMKRYNDFRFVPHKNAYDIGVMESRVWCTVLVILALILIVFEGVVVHGF